MSLIRGESLSSSGKMQSVNESVLKRFISEMETPTQMDSPLSSYLLGNGDTARLPSAKHVRILLP